MGDKIDLESLREEYSKASLNREDLVLDPFKQFEKWFLEAKESGIKEPNAMALATVNKSGIPSSRVVLLKSFDERGFVFYTNYGSSKAQDMDQNPNVAVSFLWKEIERQLRISGKITKVARARSVKYFQSRPRGSQIGAWVSNQSTIIQDRSVLEAKKVEIEKQFEGLEVLPAPEFWGGFCIVPERFEFWQGRKSRLHDRFVYQKANSSWKISRLSP